MELEVPNRHLKLLGVVILTFREFSKQGSPCSLLTNHDHAHCSFPTTDSLARALSDLYIVIVNSSLRPNGA
jgi:hypothetical protein